MSEPVPPESLRAGNADRERVVEHLNGAFAEGRLDVRELEERVAAAYAAKTLGELAPLTADLPVGRSPVPRKAAGLPAPTGPDREIDRSSRRAAIGGTFGLFLLNVLIWGAVSLGTQEWIYFWPIWTAIPFVFAVMGHLARGRER